MTSVNSFAASGIASTYADLLNFTKEAEIPQGFLASVYDSQDDLKGIYICTDTNLSSVPSENTNKWLKIKGPLAEGPLTMATEADYIVMQIATDRYTAVATRAFLPALQNSNASQLIQSCIDSLSTGNGGHVHLCSGTYRLQDEIVIRGWDTLNQPTGMIKLTGSGHATLLQQDTAGKNALVCKNKASLTLKDMRISCGLQSLSCLLFDTDNLSPISVWGGVVDNLVCRAQSFTHAAVIIRNALDVSYPHLECFNENNDAIRIENIFDSNDKSMSGTSHFGFLRAYASPQHAGLRISENRKEKLRNKINVSNYQCIQALYGIYLYGASFCSFDFVDIEYILYPIFLDGSLQNRSTGNTFKSGYLYPKDNTGRAITVTEFADGNTFQSFIQTEDDITAILKDDSQRMANSYDLSLSIMAGNWPNSGSDNRITFATGNEKNQAIRIRTTEFGIKERIPTPPDNDISARPVTSKWVSDNYLLQDAVKLLVNSDGKNATDKPWKLNISGSAKSYGGVVGDFQNPGSSIALLTGIDKSTVPPVMRTYGPEAVLKLLDLYPSRQGIRKVSGNGTIYVEDNDYTLLAEGDQDFTIELPDQPVGRLIVVKNLMQPGKKVAATAKNTIDNLIGSKTIESGQALTFQNIDGAGNYIIIRSAGIVV